jgi:hypothetical protein
MSILLVALFFATLGTQMNRAFENGAGRFFGIPLNETICVVMLVLGSVLMGMSIVFNVTGIRSRQDRS